MPYSLHTVALTLRRNRKATTMTTRNRKPLPFGYLTQLHAAEPALRPFIEAEHAARVAVVEASKTVGASVAFASDSPLYLALKAAEGARYAAHDRLNLERLRQLARS